MDIAKNLFRKEVRTDIVLSDIKPTIIQMLWTLVRLFSEKKNPHGKVRSLFSKKQFKVDLHCHSGKSYDCVGSLEKRVKKYKRKKFDIIAITDHEYYNDSDCIIKLMQKYDIYIIPAAEICTEKGDIIPLFVDSPTKALKYSE